MHGLGSRVRHCGQVAQRAYRALTPRRQQVVCGIVAEGPDRLIEMTRRGFLQLPQLMLYGRAKISFKPGTQCAGPASPEPPASYKWQPLVSRRKHPCEVADICIDIRVQVIENERSGRLYT